ncbi:MAG: L-histidine N(alpha)-methyltransferase, partial [Polyangiaceae bacterium]
MIERATSESANLRAAKKITTDTVDSSESRHLAQVVRDGLTAEKKSLPPWLFYDEEGSRLFVEITKLPEYYLGRAERSIFEKYGEDIIVQAQANDTGTAISFAELGAGTAEKTQILLHRAAMMFGRVSFMATDTSASALDIA